MSRIILAVLLLFPLSGALADTASYEAFPGLLRVGGYVVFFNSQGPLSFNTMTPDEIPAGSVDIGEVRCRSCQHGLSVPTASPTLTSRGGSSISAAQGDGSFKKAIEKLMKERPELRGIYDVKIDLHRTSILGIYRRLCTEVSARGFK